MLVCTVQFMPTRGLRRLAEQLLCSLPDMIVKAMASGGVALSRMELNVDVAPFSSIAYNLPALGIVIMTGSGQAERNQSLILNKLIELLSAWLDHDSVLQDQAELIEFGVSVDLRFTQMRGANIGPATGNVRFSWGATHDPI